mgnify:CR=1
MPESDTQNATTVTTWQCTSCMHIQGDDPDTLGVCEKCAGPLERYTPIDPTVQ